MNELAYIDDSRTTYRVNLALNYPLNNVVLRNLPSNATVTTSDYQHLKQKI